MNNIKGVAVLMAVAGVSVFLLSLISAEPISDGRFLLTVFCIVLAEAFIWAAATNPFSASKREFHQTVPFHAGMGVMAGLNLLGALVVVWLYLAGCDYTPLVVVASLLVICFVIGVSLMLAASRRAAEQGRVDDAQYNFMQMFKVNLNDLAERVRSDNTQDAAVKNGFARLCDEARYTTLQSLPGCEGINDELTKGLAALESGFVDVATTLEQIGLLESTLKRRENIIRQLRG